MFMFYTVVIYQLAHFEPILQFYTQWKDQKILRIRNGTLVWNG